jgi:hypothetical protein
MLPPLLRGNYWFACARPATQKSVQMLMFASKRPQRCAVDKYLSFLATYEHLNYF